MLKAIIFDCFGVLATDIWLEFCKKLPPEADVAQASALNKAYDKGIINYDDFFQGVKDATGQLPPDLEHMAEGQMGKNLDLLAYIAKLKPDYKIGLLSNVSSDWITREFLTQSEQQLFDDIVLSYQVDMIKPDPRLFHLVCERLGVLPEEAVMVDDRYPYADGARAIGMQGIVYQDLPDFTKQLEALLNSNK